MIKMNVVMIIADSLRQDHCACYGHPWIRTPNLDRLAGLSARFTRCCPESLPTIPVRRAMFSGRRAYPFRDYRPLPWDIVYLPGWQPMERSKPTVAEALDAAGYHTGLVTDTLPLFAPGMNFERGFRQCVRIRGQQQDRWRSEATVTDEDLAAYTFSDEHARAVASILRPYLANIRDRRREEDWSVAQVYREAVRFLHDNASGPKPFYLVIDHFDPHEPWDPPPAYTDLYDPGFEGRGRLGTHDRYGKADWLTDRQLKHMRALYAGEVTLCDAWLGRFLDALDELRLMDRTLIVFLSDHGHSLGEHNLTGKIPWAMYPELMDIPALYYDPAEKGGRVSDGLVYNLDFVSTVMDRVGASAHEPLDGMDLRPMMEGRADGRPYVTSAFKDFAYVRDERHVLIGHFKGEQFQLFDLKADPGHGRNLADEQPDLCRKLFDLALKDAGGELPLYDARATFADGSSD